MSVVASVGCLGMQRSVQRLNRLCWAAKGQRVELKKKKERGNFVVGHLCRGVRVFRFLKELLYLLHVVYLFLHRTNSDLHFDEIPIVAHQTPSSPHCVHCCDRRDDRWPNLSRLSIFDKKQAL
ncbi:hypothetical protein F2P81_025326 [Scophthalmus maximus]|uniref:Uncharacterized protein n=1 Tax=Scophthalmus maximus TaxID=52904 RepID=A0A6A4RV71_SCOMX|nr:hypothetical protein F2P81_025326 [Scophthalmus maximus]